jgi:hypothetical protein
MQQPDLFSGDELRDFGMQAAERDRTLICQAVDTAIRILAQTRLLGFTAEDVRLRLRQDVRDLDDVSKVIGARIRANAVAGLIHTRGETVKATRPDAHARRMLTWYRTSTLEEIA